jgi:hypothetical protein
MSKLLGNFQISIHASHISYMSKILECINTKGIYMHCLHIHVHIKCVISKPHKTLMLPIRTKVTHVYYHMHKKICQLEVFIKHSYEATRSKILHFLLVVCNSHMLLSCNLPFHVGTINQVSSLRRCK